MSVSAKVYVWRDFQQQSVSRLLKDLPEDGWFEASCGDGSKGPRIYDWLPISMNQGATPGFERSLLIKRSKSKSEK